MISLRKIGGLKLKESNLKTMEWHHDGETIIDDYDFHLCQQMRYH